MACSSQNAILVPFKEQPTCPNKGNSVTFVASTRDVKQLVEAIAVTVDASSCKVLMDDRLLCGNATSRVINEQVVQQVEAYVIKGRDDGCDIGAVPLGKRGLEVGE
jgi:hypothetical protein